MAIALVINNPNDSVARYSACSLRKCWAGVRMSVRTIIIFCTRCLYQNREPSGCGNPESAGSQAKLDRMRVHAGDGQTYLVRAVSMSRLSYQNTVLRVRL